MRYRQLSKSDVTVPEQGPFASGALEQRLFRYGLIVIPLLTLGIVIAAGVDIENVLSLLAVCVSLLLVRGTGAELPFLLMAVDLLVLTLYAAFFLKAAMVELPTYYAAVETTVGVLWLSIYPLCAAIGVRIAAATFRRRYAGRQLGGPALPLVFLVPAWIISIVIGLLDPQIEDLLSIAVIHNFIPLLSVLLVLRTPSRGLRALIVLVTFVVAALTTYRYVFGEYLLLYSLTYLLHVREVPRRLLLRMLAVAAIGSVAFYGITILKYGEFKQGQLFTRTMLIEAHASMRVKQAVDDGFAFGFRESEEMKSYWLGLVPFTGKPINSGTYTFNLSRTRLAPDEKLPYLPPAAPAELYMTGGYPALIVGACIHGLLLGWAWQLARLFRNSPVQCMIFAMVTTMLIGVGGGIDLYGRIEAVKWVLYVGLLFWILASFFNHGVLMTRRAGVRA